MTPQERIKADAEAYAERENSAYVNDYNGYIAGATAENDRAQGLVDALEAITGVTMPVPNKADMIEIAKTALAKWKGEGGAMWEKGGRK